MITNLVRCAAMECVHVFYVLFGSECVCMGQNVCASCMHGKFVSTDAIDKQLPLCGIHWTCVFLANALLSGTISETYYLLFWSIKIIGH